MITIGREAADPTELLMDYPEGSTQRQVLSILTESGRSYNYADTGTLRFELKLRREIVSAAEELNASRLEFQTFRDSFCNTDYWARMPDGGFALKRGVLPADAVRDIYRSSEKYGTECATAMLMVYYKALAETFSEEAFNRTFENIYLMNWHRIEPELRETGLMKRETDYLPGDRRYFRNPDVDPATPEWQGENVIDLGEGFYYGHGIGRHRAEVFIRALNQNRKDGANQSAYLLDSAARPNFSRLAALAKRYPAERG